MPAKAGIHVLYFLCFDLTPPVAPGQKFFGSFFFKKEPLFSFAFLLPRARIARMEAKRTASRKSPR